MRLLVFSFLHFFNPLEFSCLGFDKERDISLICELSRSFSSYSLTALCSLLGKYCLPPYPSEGKDN